MSWPGGRWRRRSGTWGWRSGDRRRCRMAGARRCRLLLGIVRLLLARQRGNLPAVAEEARRLQALAEAPDAAQPGLGEELRALALISLGSTEFWTARFEEAERHLEQGVALARRIGRPFLEFTGLAYLAAVEIFRSFARAAERSRQAIELAERHGWTDEPAAGLAYVTLGAVLAGRGGWRRQSPGSSAPSAPSGRKPSPRRGWGSTMLRGLLELARGRDAEALAAFRAAERLAGRLAAPHCSSCRTRALLLHTLVRLGETERAEQALAALGEHDRDRGEMRTATAVLRLAQDDPRAAAAALAPVLDGSAPVPWRVWLAHAFLLEAIARDALGDPAAAGRALERALDLAEPDGALFLVPAAPGAGPARAPCPAAHRARRPDRRDPQPAGRPDARAAARRAATAARAAERQRDPGAALPADQPVHAGDRRRAVRLAQHRQDPHAPPVRQARHAPPSRGRRARPCPRPAGTLPAQGPSHASSPGLPGPCQPAATGGYLGAENQMLRVMVTSVDASGVPTIVWGFDDARASRPLPGPRGRRGPPSRRRPTQRARLPLTPRTRSFPR